MRGSGCGSMLYRAVIEQAYNENVLRLEWNVLSWNKPAIDFYEKSGAKVLDDWRVAQMDRETMSKYLAEKH